MMKINLTSEGMDVTKVSIITSREHTMTMDITLDQVDAWLEGELVQDAFPNLNEVEREFLISGMSEAEQKEFFE